MFVLLLSVDLEDMITSQRSPDCYVRSGTYWSYIKAMGGVLVFIILLVSFMVSIAIQSVTTGYLAYWLNQEAGYMVSV